MFCTKCGQNVPDGTTFCTNCGAKLGAPGPAARPAAPMGGYQRPTGSAALSTLKSTFASPLALAAIIAYSVTVLCSLINVISGMSGSANYLYMIASMTGLGYEIMQYGSLITVIVVLLMVPQVLIAVGMWMTYVSAADPLSPSLRTGGLTVNRVISIVYGVLMCILTAVMDIVLFVLIAEMDGYFDTGYLVGILLAATAALVLVIVFYFKSAKLIKEFSDTALTGIAPAKVSVFVPVMSIIIGVFSFISLFSTRGAIPIISCLCSAAASILFGVLIFMYRSKVVLPAVPAGMAGYSPVRAPQAGYNPQPGVYQAPSYNPAQQQAQAPSAGYTPSASFTQPRPQTQPQPQAAPAAAPAAEQQLVTCAKCGSKFNAEYNVCPYCGQPKQ